MLLLTHRIGESIFIGDQIVAKVLDVLREDKVRLGIEVPAETKVQRAEQCEPSQMKSPPH